MVKNDNEDIMLSVAFAKKKAIIMLSLIEREDIYNEVIQGIMANMELELVSKQRFNLGQDVRQLTDNRFMKEYRDKETKARFIMTNSQRFSVEFGEYKYEGYFPVGTREKFQRGVKEVTFYVSNAMKVKERPTSMSINRFAVTEIKKIKV
ncbi:hypothetical protein CJ195_18355 [Bacillus sp. UMB0899]|nr:hypothetical protein CJ195_18355 [Bacillus sp. UMB0899]